MLADPLALQTFRHHGFDQYQRWRPRDYVPVPVRIVDIDEASLAKTGQWPWPRTKLAQLVDQLDKQGAAAIGFDVVFAEPDRTSPRRASAQWPLPPSAKAVLDDLPDHDTVFAQAIARHGVVLGFAVRNDAQPSDAQAVVPHAPTVMCGWVSPVCKRSMRLQVPCPRYPRWMPQPTAMGH